ncbi:MAG TPA: outer membrane protein assembly factor BamA [Saprospiraceae bacterium]|nr:outer membrane protein assembly factor BamA [Saprospiraceae bacterium]
MKVFFTLVFSCFGLVALFSQTPFMEYDRSKSYEIGSIAVKGNQYSDEKAIIAISGLRVGKKISLPGLEVPSAIKSIYKQRLFTSVDIVASSIVGDIVSLEIKVVEKPRYSSHRFTGVKKAAHDDLNEIVNEQLVKNSIFTEDLKENIIRNVSEFYKDKGYLDAHVSITETPEPKKDNAVKLIIDIKKGKRVKIERISFDGNETVSSWRLRKKLSKTKSWRQIFSKSRLLEDEYVNDKDKLVAYYRSSGYRDAEIVSDSMWRTKANRLRIHMNIHEGKRYYFRDISIKGNTLYKTEHIKNVLGIQKGDIYNEELLQKRLSFSQDGRDVSSLYMDEGYLFFRAEPVELGIEKDSVDIEVRITEGAQATIDRVVINGNDRTHEHVVRRELRTRPGQKFSRADIIRSQRAIMALGFFNPETIGMNTPVNPRRGTVDIEYSVEERPSDQLELSAGWSQFGLIGTLGVVFNNFSTRNIFKKSTWSPLPQGDGQKLSLRAQSNGRFFQTYNCSFTEPWLGGKKPNSLTVALAYTALDYSNSGSGKLGILRGSATLASQLKRPDDNFVSSTTLNLERIRLNNYIGFSSNGQYVRDGDFYNISLRQTIARNTIADPLFPRSGSRISLTVQFTPPYSLLGNKLADSSNLSQKFRWVEYHKWRIDGEWYFNLVNKLVLACNAKIGILGSYNKSLGAPPFERYQVGGAGLNQNQANSLVGLDIIALRGYNETDARFRTTNDRNNSSSILENATVFNKFTVELRYPLSLNPSASIFALIFAQGGNSWVNIKDYNPFDLKRSFGVGARVFLPMFGLLGFNYGIGIDKPWLTEQKASLKSYGEFNFILGFEPE